ncbi:thioredoxin family protein [Companilactobacillus mishanensis]|uniref:Thioredoxin n=1 Tax=Companilactobacillus mishanensis TaxID=2486008 RepID=A0A5P0ZGF4_9LACO|nr:thioredoxin domain-containing protein [Companilactobacillus mishanensis]MQS43915.1 thioredoxin [Companilactobacillus mishanensis]MQS52127.1 thioredoxin [Companilactobacillus mishanensis]MQS88215.1 thioredoxin [Companilactobacillus mishanensis]
MMEHLTKENLESTIADSKGLIMIDFFSPKCVPCMALMPDVEKLADEKSDDATFYAFDTTGNMRTAMKQKVMGIPAYLFYKDGEKVATLDKEILEDKGMAAVTEKLDELTVH